jgi:hypothetical protein
MPSIDEKARSLFLSALERGTGEWRAYREEVCGGDTELRSRVDELLKAHQALGSIHISDGNTPGPTIDHPHAEGPGTRIGSYKLVELIGEGGMGVVYLAQQTEPVKRLVALKVIKAGMDSRQVLARFEAERQALALMDHPNIAKVLDAGTISVGWAESSRPTMALSVFGGPRSKTRSTQATIASPAQARISLIASAFGSAIGTGRSLGWKFLVESSPTACR